MRNLFNYFRGLIPLIALLFMLPATIWGATTYTATNPATKTFASKTFLDVAGTQTNATISSSNTDVLTYSAYYISHTMNPVWYAIVSGTTAQEAGGSYSFSTAAANGFLATGATSANGNNAYGYMNVRSTTSYQRYIYFTGCTNVAILYKSASSKTTQIVIEEVSSSGTYSTVGSTASGSSTSVAILSHASTLDDSKYYRMTLKASGTSNCSVYQIRFTPGVNDPRTPVNISSFTATSTTIMVNGGSTTTQVSNDQSNWTPSYTYTSSNENVATVDENGVITGHAEGEADITVAANIPNNDTNWKKGGSKSLTIVVDDPNSLKAEKTTFGTGETSGTLKKKGSSEDSEITYSSAQGDGTTPPAISSSKLRIYKPASEKSTGGYLELKANDGYVITGFTLSLGKKGSLQSSIDGGDLTKEESSTAAAWTYTMSALSAHNIKVYNVGSDSEDIASILVTYAEEEITSYRATYQAGYGADADVVDVDIADCPTYTLKAAPTSPSTYLQFVGWNDGENTYSAGAAYPLTKHVTFNAVWEFTNQATAYTKATAATMIIGGTYVWQAQKSDNTKYVATAMGENTYLGATVLGTYSSLSGNTLTLTSETPQSFIFSLAEAGWLIEDAANTGNYLREIGENKLEWNEEKSVWTMNGEGSDVPSFANKYGDADYTMYANLGSSRFNAYTSKGTNADAVLYHLASESAHTLSLVIDGETTKTYTVKDDYSWTLPTPQKYGFIFQGWATEAEGAVIYADGASYTMPTEAKSLYAVWEAQTIAPSFTTDLNDAEPYQHMKGNNTVVKLTIAADHADTYQWYEAVSATSYEGATLLTGETSESYTCSNTEIGTKYFFCTLTNAVGSINSKIATVNTVGSNLCALSHVEFSNGFDAFIKNNTITAYYMTGTTAPTIVESSIKVSDNATKVIEGSTLTVTAEDGTTQAAYSIVLSEVTPLTVSTDGEATFDGNEDWIKTGYGWDATKGWMFSKNVEDATPRISEGRNRLYFFVGPAKTLVLNNTGVDYNRTIEVYVNGSKSAITIGKSSEANHTITLSGLKDNDNNMVAIVSNNTGGDGGFTKFTYTANPQHHIIYKVNGAAAKEEDVYEGYALTFPSVADQGGKVFLGWKKGSGIDGEVENFTDFADTQVNATESVEYYAVFATKSGTSSTEEFSMSATSKTQNGITIAATNGSGNNDPAYTSGELRIYASNTITISSDDYITAISLTFHKQGSKDYIKSITANEGEYVSGGESTSGDDDKVDTWSGSSKSITLTAGNSGQRVFVSASVTVGSTVYSDYCTSITSCDITLTHPESGAYGFSTFCGSANYTVEGADAYKASVVSGELVLTKLEGIIPAGNSDYENGVVIAGTPGGIATIRYTSEDANADMTGNQLLGTLAITPTETLKNGADYLMVFSKSNGGFVSYKGTDVPAYKACLPYSDNAGAPMRMVFGRDNLPTNNVNVNVNDNLGTKVMIDGRLYILRDGKTYDSFGRLVK